MFGWLGNVFIVVGLWMVGNKNRNCFLWTMAGEAAYAAHVYLRRDWAILAAVGIFFFMALRNYIKWGENENRTPDCCRREHIDGSSS